MHEVHPREGHEGPEGE